MLRAASQCTLNAHPFLDLLMQPTHAVAEAVAGKASTPSVDDDDEASVEAMQDLKLCVALRQV